MKGISLVLSDTAVSDIVEQADWYFAQSGATLAKRWDKAVQKAILRIVRAPRVGALCNFKSAELRDVRRLTIPGFARHLLFYRLQDRQILILRLVHGARDLERLF